MGPLRTAKATIALASLASCLEPQQSVDMIHCVLHVAFPESNLGFVLLRVFRTLPSGMNLREAPMRELNRSAIVVTPKQPFLDWLHSADPSSSDLTLYDLGQEPTIYLVRESESDEDFADCLRETFPVIFEDQLAGWWTDQSAWPPNRTLDTFQAWFDCQFHSMVLDLHHEPLIHERL